MNRLLVCLALLAATAAFAEDAAPTLGVGTDLVVEQQCLGCHGAGVGEAWANLSSHKVLYDCKVCHTPTAASGKGHASTRACTDCHSSASHPTAATACGTCHDVHGAVNAFLLRATVQRPDGTTVPVHVTKPEGASNDGLVHAGVAGATAGTGLCETCHHDLAHYNADGTGTPHATEYCGTCHSHQDGFAPGSLP